ncbi:MAG: four helix bundle protein [Candidatus Daviesbacteria bacterium]|nr:four helix bundle protein [Candidatus Daviesbacteria bacterium]
MTSNNKELFGLVSQLQRAALSVPTNIVEGHARNNRKEFHRFLSIALGSLAETEYLLDFAFKRKFIRQDRYNEIMLLREETGRIIWKLFLSQK